MVTALSLLDGFHQEIYGINSYTISL